MLFRYQRTVLAVTTATNEDQTGDTYAVLPNEELGEAAEPPSYRVWFILTQSGGASSPTTDCVLQGSPDGTNFATLKSATQVTTSTTSVEWKELEGLSAYVRVKSTLGGGTKPNHALKVVLASTRPFKLQEV